MLYVSDKNITWYSAPGMADRIVESILDVIKQLGNPRVVCIGHSMGGFGALLFCERLEAASTIAFAPQYAIDMNIVLDIRIRKGRETAHVENLEVIGDHLTGKVKPNILCGKVDEDLRHLELFEENCDIAEWIVDFPKSGIPGYLIEHGLEDEVLAALVANDYEAVDRALEGRLVGYRY